MSVKVHIQADWRREDNKLAKHFEIDSATKDEVTHTCYELRKLLAFLETLQFSSDIEWVQYKDNE